MKKLLITALVAFFLASDIYSQNGFEISLNLPGNVAWAFSSGVYKEGSPPYKSSSGGYKNKPTPSSGFEYGFLVQPGYLFSIKPGMSVSVLADVGYKRDSFNYKSKRILYLRLSTRHNTATHFAIDENYLIDSFNFGIIPKLNLANLSIGFGVGVKVAFAASHYRDTLDTGFNRITKYNNVFALDKLGDGFKNILIPYIKVSCDYSVYIFSKTAISIGVLIGYDFLILPNAESSTFAKYESSLFSKNLFSSLNMGLQIGLKFGPKTEGGFDIRNVL